MVREMSGSCARASEVTIDKRYQTNLSSCLPRQMPGVKRYWAFFNGFEGFIVAVDKLKWAQKIIYSLAGVECWP
jgi:hypothetical protein